MLARWQAGEVDHTPGGEARSAFVERIATTLAGLAAAHGEGTMLAVTHGGFIGALQRAHGADDSRARIGNLVGRWVEVAGIVGILMLPLAAMSVVVTPPAVGAMDRFGVKRVLVAGVVLLIVASAAMWLLTASFAIPLVIGVTALLGVPYGVVSIATSQGMFLSTRPEERGVAAGNLPDLPLRRRHHGDSVDRHLLWHRREPGQLGAYGVRDAGPRRSGIRSVPAVAGAAGIAPRQRSSALSRGRLRSLP